MSNADKLTAARNCNRDTPVSKPTPQQNCSDIINISVFFDGTGNNKDADDFDEKWSNPARIWRASQFMSEKNSSNHSIYVSGVGTKFNGDPTGWIDEKWKACQDGKILGMGVGAGGSRRLDSGEANVNDRLRAELIKSAAKLDISLKPYVEKGKPANIRQLAAAIEAHGFITIINLSIFGFSRGAALARAFSNNILRECVTDSEGVLRYKGMPIRINFMGLFDTVASFGWPGKNIDAPFDERDLTVPHAVERCVHFIAAHELRFSFPVDLIRKNGELKPGWVETVYPGVHSDVGGGYEPVCQNISNNYSRIPMKDMMREAMLHGVRMLSYEDIEKNYSLIFTQVYKVWPEVEADYKQYINAVGEHSNVEQAVTAHMKALYSGWGTMTRRNIKTPDLIDKMFRDGPFKNFGHRGIAYEASFFLSQEETLQTARNHLPVDLPPRTLNVENKMHGFTVRPAKWRLEAWKANAPDPIFYFIQRYVHDSKSGFIHSLEPFSYFTARGMAESSRNVLAAGLGWMGKTLTAIKTGVIKIYNRVECIVVETWEEGKLVATNTYRIGEKFVVDTVRAGVRYTVEFYRSSKEVLISTIEKGEQLIITSIDIAKKKANAAAEATHKKAVELSDAAQRKFGEISDATQKKATEVGNQIYDGASSVAKGVGQAVDTGMQTVEDGWHAVRSAIGI